MAGSPKFIVMIRNQIEPLAPTHPGRRDRVVDWLGAQGPLLLTVYMCSAVALVAFLVDVMG